MALKGFRDRIKSFILGRRWKAPLILTEWGPVTESARLQAAMNMKADPDLRKRVETLLVFQMGSVAKGLAEAHRRYPEVYDGEES